MNQWINQFLENEIVNRTDKTDRTDKPKDGGPLSVLSVRPPGLLDEKMGNMSEPDISDKPDRLGLNLNMSGSLQVALDVLIQT